MFNTLCLVEEAALDQVLEPAAKDVSVFCLMLFDNSFVVCIDDLSLYL